MRRTKQSFLIALFVMCGLLWAQTKPPIVLERADSLRSTEENGVRKQVLNGHVWITRDSLSVTCDNAVYYPDSGLVIFRNNVEFKDPKRTLLADEVIYNEFTEEVFASNHVRVYQGDSLSTSSRTARYKERLKSGFLYDDVKIRQESRHLQLTGDLGFIDQEQNFGWVTADPVLTERDSLLRVITEIHGDTISYDHALKVARATGHVTVNRDSLVSSGKRLVYHKDLGYAEMLGDPRAVRNQDVVTGDTLRLFFKSEQLDHVEILGHALGTSPADSGAPEPLNRMEGKKMTLWVDSVGVKEVLVEGTAIATYYVRDKGQPRGMNVTSGDQLHVFFENRRMSRIRVEGGTEGDYTPQKLLTRASESKKL
jgi:lipopolysaccharide export system protein LptA